MAHLPAGDWLTTSEVAAMFSRSEKSVQLWITKQQLPGVRVGNRFLVLRSDAERFQLPEMGRPFRPQGSDK